MKNASRILSLLLCLVMVLSCFSLMTFNAVAEEEANPLEFTDVQKIVLGTHDGDPFPPHAAGQSFAVKTTVAADRRLASICAGDLATYSAPCHEIKYEIFQWNTDYATSVGGTCLWSYTEYDHADNSTITIPLDNNTAINGEILIVFTCIEAEAGITPWKSNATPENTTFFDNGSECGSFTFVIETAAYVDVLAVSPDPTFVISFADYCGDTTAEYGIQNPNGVEYDKVINSGYITFKDVSGDPYVWLMGKTGLYELATKYVDNIVVTYRSFGGTSAEFFVQRADGVQPGQPGSHVGFGITGDGLWHTAVVDATSEWGTADTKLTIFRLDPLANNNGCEIDIAEIAFFASPEAAQNYAASKLETVEVKAELPEGDPSIYAISGYNWTFDKWYDISEKLEPCDPATAEYEGFSGHVSTDTFKINKQVYGTDGQALAAIESVENKVTVTEDIAFIGFRGWVGNNDKPVEKLGYALNDGAPVWSDDNFEATGDDVRNAGGANAQRFDVEIDAQSIANGTYNVYVLVKFEGDDVVYRMTQWPDFQIIVGDGQCYKSEGLCDADGNLISLRGQRVLDAKGADTGMLAFVCDDGRMVAGRNFVQLSYQDPLAGAIEVDGKQYIYDTKVAVTDVMTPVDPEDNSADSDAYAAAADGVAMSPDSWRINGVNTHDGSAAAYLTSVEGIVRNTAKDLESFGFRGWAYAPDGSAIDAFGYSLNNGEIQWTGNIVLDEVIIPILNQDEVRRFEIDIDCTADALADGQYIVHTYMRDVNGTIYKLSAWPTVKFIQGGHFEHTGYTDGTNTYGLDAVILTEGDQKYVLTNAIEVTEGNEDQYKGKYVCDTVVTFLPAPKAPVNPNLVKPVYVLDGEGLNTLGASRMEDAVYDYDKGCVRYVATGGDPNSGSNQIPAGTVVAPYMVVKYRTEYQGARGEIFLGKGNGAIGGSNVPFPSEYIADGQWHYFVINVGASGDYDHETNVINHFRNDCLQGEGHWVEIEYYAFFDNAEDAEYYAANDMHELPQPPKTFVATFVADGETVGTVEFKEGAKTLTGIPKVPAKEGYTGKWEKYTLADADITINAVYTAKEGEATEPDTEPATEPTDVTEPATEPTATEPATEPAVVTEPATEADATEADATAADATEADTAAEEGGCKSVVAASGVIALIAVIGMAVIGKKKEN